MEGDGKETGDEEEGIKLGGCSIEVKSEASFPF